MDAFIQLPEDQRRLYCEQAQAKLGLPLADYVWFRPMINWPTGGATTNP